MKRLPRISIVIPSYNKVDFIKRTFDSIVNQSYPNLEILVEDGGSTDGTLEIIKRYAERYPKLISWESAKDSGQTSAINRGLRKAKGKILTYLNADDVYEKGALKKVGEYFAENPDILWLVGNGKIIDTQGEEIAGWVTNYKNFLLSLNSYFLLLITNYITQPSVFLNRSAYEKYGPFSGSKSGVMEYDLWLKLGKIQMPHVINETFASFRLASANLSAVNFETILSEDYKIAKKYTNDPLILFLHWLHNVGRVIVLFFTNL